MISRRSLYLLLPTLALGLTLAMAPAAQAVDADLSVTFGHSPHWVGVHGTRVREIRTADRPDYDMFSYGGSYYAYNNNHWYSSRRSRGHFRAIEDRQVPMQISKVPRDHWHTYPAAWDNQNANPAQGQRPGGDMHRH